MYTIFFTAMQVEHSSTSSTHGESLLSQVFKLSDRETKITGTIRTMLKLTDNGLVDYDVLWLFITVLYYRAAGPDAKGMEATMTDTLRVVRPFNVFRRSVAASLYHYHAAKSNTNQ